MTFNEFKIGERFECNGHQWQVTDIGTRVVVAALFKEGWMNGPPYYAVAEMVFDENDIEACSKVQS